MALRINGPAISPHVDCAWLRRSIALAAFDPCCKQAKFLETFWWWGGWGCGLARQKELPCILASSTWL